MTSSTPPAPEPKKEPRGFWRKILHSTGTGLKVAGETIIEIALANAGAFEDQ